MSYYVKCSISFSTLGVTLDGKQVHFLLVNVNFEKGENNLR